MPFKTYEKPSAALADATELAEKALKICGCTTVQIDHVLSGFGPEDGVKELIFHGFHNRDGQDLALPIISLQATVKICAEGPRWRIAPSAELSGSCYPR